MDDGWKKGKASQCSLSHIYVSLGQAASVASTELAEWAQPTLKP